MESHEVFFMLLAAVFIKSSTQQCYGGQTLTYARWSGVSPERATPVFVYAASGEEESLSGACLARCRELSDCAAVAVAYDKGNCHGIADADVLLRPDNDVSYFKKICIEVPEQCRSRWWAVESTPGYHLHTEGSGMKVIINATVQECYYAMLNSDQLFRSAQWIGSEGTLDPELINASSGTIGSCLVHEENKFTEPESYRVSNYFTFYMENQCHVDYPKKIDRCSYEEYYNQTLRHVEFTYKNYTKSECKTACEVETHFVCRGFTWSAVQGLRDPTRGLCDLHSEDLVTTGSWLLRRTGASTYYRRVICLNITVECEQSHVTVTYRPRGQFKGRVYVPGRSDKCSARAAAGGEVRLALPMNGDCDVNFAYAISNGPTGPINRTMAYVTVMIQNNPIIQTAGDRWVRVGCSPDAKSTTRVDASLAVRDTGRPSIASETADKSIPAAASAVYSNSAPLTMYVVRAQQDSSSDGAAGAVSLGEPLELRIETTDESEIEAYHLVASSRLGDSSVLLLDSRGCPTGQVDFPPFTRSWLGGTQRLSARFKAFRFPTSHVVRFALMVRFCEGKCQPMKCQLGRAARETNDTLSSWNSLTPPYPKNTPSGDNSFHKGTSNSGVVAQGGTRAMICGPDVEGRIPLEVEMVVGSRDILSADTLIRADHRSTVSEETPRSEGMVCVHELLLVAVALAWLAVQVLLLLGCCVLVKRYRNLAEMSMHKEYQSFDNVGFETGSTHRRVHWPDQNIDVMHGT